MTGSHAADPRLQRDRALGAIASALFSLALGVVSLIVPLLALQAGLDAIQVGLLVALSAMSQLITRSLMGALMRRVPDKVLVIAAAGLIASSSALLALSTSLASFIVAQVLLGSSRASFFTGNQTHAIRVSTSSVRGMTVVNLAGSAGALLGPAIAGLLAGESAKVALWGGTGIALACVIPAAMLVRLPPFTGTSREAGRIWRRPGVGIACWGGAASGTWRGALDSYVPVALALAGHSVPTIGALVSLANGAAVVGSGVAGWTRKLGMRGSLVSGVVSTAAGIMVIGAVAPSVFIVAAALMLSGLGAGLLQTIAPAFAADGVGREERGDAVASVGLFRASALFAAPSGMAAVVLVAPISIAFAITGVAIAIPALIPRERRR